MFFFLYIILIIFFFWSCEFFLVLFWSCYIGFYLLLVFLFLGQVGFGVQIYVLFGVFISVLYSVGGFGLQGRQLGQFCVVVVVVQGVLQMFKVVFSLGCVLFSSWLLQDVQQRVVVGVEFEVIFGIECGVDLQ